MYSLEHPWLLAVLPLPLLAWWLLPAYRQEAASVRLPFFADVASAAGLEPSAGAVVARTNVLQKLLAPVCWALVVLALARPVFVEPPVTKDEPARDLLLALDLSQSMDTPDFRDPAGKAIPRVDAVRAVVGEFVARRKTDRLGLVVFGDAAYPEAPLTLDHATVEAMVADVVPGMAGPSTALGDAIGLGIKMFAESRAPEKVLILLTDGNDTASRMPPAKAAEIARDAKIRIHAVGIGDPSATGEQKLDTDTLRKIAATTGGRYFFGQDQTQLAQIWTELDRITPANQHTLSWRPKRDLFFWPLGAAVGLLLAFLLVRLLASSRRPVTA